jgi:hypothetical protein
VAMKYKPRKGVERERVERPVQTDRAGGRSNEYLSVRRRGEGEGFLAFARNDGFVAVVKLGLGTRKSCGIHPMDVVLNPPVDRSTPDSSLRRPTIPHERDGKKSACFVRKDRFVEVMLNRAGSKKMTAG